jgi:hypothetical protein
MSRTRRTLYVLRRLLPFVFGFLRDRRRWIVFGAPPVAPGRGAPRAGPADRGRDRRTRPHLHQAGAGLLLPRGHHPRALPQEIGRLQDAVEPVPADADRGRARGGVRGAGPRLFDAFDRVPIASASLGQVHRARVRRPRGRGQGAAPRRGAAGRARPGHRLPHPLPAQHLFPNHHVRALTAVVREFERRIGEEMDLRKGGREHERSAASSRRTRGFGRRRSTSEFTRRRVLVTEFVEGTKVDRLQERSPPAPSPSRS